MRQISEWLKNPSRPKLEIFETYEDLSQAAAKIIQEKVSVKPTAVLLLPTGKTPIRLYEILVQRIQASELNLKATTIFMLDEYFGGQDYRHYIEQHLLNPLHSHQRPKVFVLGRLTKDAEQETKQYEKKIREIGVDFAVLGVNSTGHIGFNEQGSPFDSKTRLVKLSEQTIKDNHHLMERVLSGGEPYTHALSVGIDTVLFSQKILVLAKGAQKSKPIQYLFSGGPTSKIPISSLLLRAEDVSVLVDREAAQLL